MSGTLERFGRYLLIRRLAQGGMAEIWLARDARRPDQDLVVKRIHPHLATNAEFVMMFLDEARIAARLDHPGCVQIFDLGRHEDGYFIAMEYVHGEDIRSIARQARRKSVPLPRKLAVEIIAGACEGLHYAHGLKDGNGRALDIVHRDVSPQNILVTYDGRMKIVDFGIAKAADQATKTRAGVLKGKYAYMSPEQVMGLPLDRRSDVFALGVLLYELTTGRRLFKADSEVETMRRITRGEIVPPTEASPGYPADLERIVLRALAGDRDHRYESADALQRALRAFLADHHSSVAPEALARFMGDLFAERLAAEQAARDAMNEDAFLDARFGEEKNSEARQLESLEVEVGAMDLTVGGGTVGGVTRPGDAFPDGAHEETEATGQLPATTIGPAPLPPPPRPRRRQSHARPVAWAALGVAILASSAWLLASGRDGGRLRTVAVSAGAVTDADGHAEAHPEGPGAAEPVPLEPAGIPVSAGDPVPTGPETEGSPAAGDGAGAPEPVPAVAAPKPAPEKAPTAAAPKPAPEKAPTAAAPKPAPEKAPAAAPEPKRPSARRVAAAPARTTDAVERTPVDAAPSQAPEDEEDYEDDDEETVDGLRTGRLELRLADGIDVFLDGVRIGTTPLPPQRVPLGRHTLKLIDTRAQKMRVVPISIGPEDPVVVENPAP